MAITANQAQGLVLALFGASAGGHLTSLSAASSVAGLAADLATSAGLILGKDLSSNTAFRDHVLTSSLKLTGAALTDAQTWMDGEFTKGTARGDILTAAVTYLDGLTDASSVFYAAASSYRDTVKAAVTWSQGAGAATFGVAALRAQQGNTDVVAGNTFTLTTGTDTLIGTAGNDTFTGVDTSSTSTDQYADTDRIVDSSTTDSDTANLTLVGAATPQVVNVEAVNANINSLSSVTLTASGMTGVANLTVTRGNVEVGGSILAGNKAVVVDALNAGAIAKVTAGAGTTTVNVTQAAKAGVVINADTASGNTDVIGAATVTAAGAGAGDTVTVTAMNGDTGNTAAQALAANALAVSVTTNAATVTIANDANGGTAEAFTGAITVDAGAATTVSIANAVGGATVTAGVTSTADSTISVNNIDSSGATIVTGTGARETTTPVKEITVNLDGTAATTDAASISGAGWITVNQDNTDLVENLTLSGKDAAVTFDMTGTLLAAYTLTGSQNVTLRGDAAIFTEKTITDSTSATTTLTLDTLGADADLSAAAVDSINVAATGSARTLTLASGANVVLAADQTTSLTLAGKTSASTINLSTADDTAASGATIDLTTGTLNAATNVSTLNIDATVGKLTLATALTMSSTGTVNVSGTKAVDLAAVTAKTVNAANLTGALTIGSAASTALTSVTSGSGDDSITVNAAAAYTIVTGAGVDTVDLGANALDASNVATGDGDDLITVRTAESTVIAAGTGSDTVYVTGVTDSIFAMGDGTDTVDLVAMDVSSATTYANFSMTDVEVVDITDANGSVVINSTSFARDNVFKIVGDSATADIFRVKNVSSTAGANIDASGITFAATQSAKLILEGGVKTDTITGSAKNDTIVGTKGGDTIDGGNGTDTFDASGLDAQSEVTDMPASDGVVINLGSSAVTAAQVQAAIGTYLANDVASVTSGKVAYTYAAAAATNSAVLATLSSIENVTGSDGADYIVGTANANVIDGGAGNDYIVGGAGADTMTAGTGTTTYVIGNTDSGITVATADTITDFVAADDAFELGAAGDATANTGNYVEVADAAYADFAAVLTALNTAAATLAGTSDATEIYVFAGDTTGDDTGYIGNDIDGDGDIDQVIILTGIVAAEISAADLI